MIGIDYPLKGISEDMSIILVGVPPFKLLQVSSQMLTGNLVERPNDGTLEQGPYAFYKVGVNVTVNPFLYRVIEGFMTGVMVFNPQIAFQFIGVDSFGFILDSPVDEGMEDIPLDIGYLFQLSR